MHALKTFADKVLTITADNGIELADHEVISKALNTKFYFLRPYALWE